MNDSQNWDESVLQGIVTRAEEKVVARGQAIVRRDIRSIARDGSLIRARVAGPDVVPFRVDIDAATGKATCTCLYQWGEACKHMVAVALLALNEGEAIEPALLRRDASSNASPDTSALASSFSEDDAIAMLEELKQRFPHAVREFVGEQMHHFEFLSPNDA